MSWGKTGQLSKRPWSRAFVCPPSTEPAFVHGSWHKCAGRCHCHGHLPVLGPLPRGQEHSPGCSHVRVLRPGPRHQAGRVLQRLPRGGRVEGGWTISPAPRACNHHPPHSTPSGPPSPTNSATALSFSSVFFPLNCGSSFQASSSEANARRLWELSEVLTAPRK